MAKVKMCANYNCESRQYCYRYTAEPNEEEFQPYLMEPPLEIEKCIKYSFHKKQTSSNLLEIIDERNKKAVSDWKKAGYLEEENYF